MKGRPIPAWLCELCGELLKDHKKECGVWYCEDGQIFLASKEVRNKNYGKTT